MSNFQEQVTTELATARGRYLPIHSLHEGYAVIQEEVDELWDIVKKWKGDTPHGNRKARTELVQIAAMCQRMAEDLEL